MKTAPILAALVVLSNFAYAEKAPRPARETAPANDRSKQPATRPVTSKPATRPATAPFNPKEISGTARNTPSAADLHRPDGMIKGDESSQPILGVRSGNTAGTANPNQTPPAQGATAKPAPDTLLHALAENETLIAPGSDHSQSARTANPNSKSATAEHNQTDFEFVKTPNNGGVDVPAGTQVHSSKNPQPASPGARSLVDENGGPGGGLEEGTETGTEEPTSGAESAAPAERRAHNSTVNARPISAAPNTPPAAKWELGELDAAKNTANAGAPVKTPRPKPAATAQPTPSTPSSSATDPKSVNKKPADIKSGE
jgi:hypothetical protein